MFENIGPGHGHDPFGRIFPAVMQWGPNCTQKVEVAHKEEALPPFCTASGEKLGVAWEQGWDICTMRYVNRWSGPPPECTRRIGLLLQVSRIFISVACRIGLEGSSTQSLMC